MKSPFHNKFLSLEQFEAYLTVQYKGKLCSFTYPGYDTVYGMCDSIAVDTAKLPEQIIVIILGRSDGLHRYTCSAETLSECLKLLP